MLEAQIVKNCVLNKNEYDRLKGALYANPSLPAAALGIITEKTNVLKDAFENAFEAAVD